MNHSSLWSEISQLSSLAASASIFCLGAMLVRSELRKREKDDLEVSRIVSESMTTASGKSTTISGNYEKLEDYPGGRLTINLLSALLAIASLSMFIRAMVKENPHPSSISLHDVHVLSRLDSQNFVVDAPDANGNRVQFAITSCPDLMPTDEIRAGIRLKWIQYVEDRVHHCQELDGPVSGYALERDKHNVPIVHDWTKRQADLSSPGSSSSPF